MDPQLLRNCLKMAVAVFITAAIAVWCERVEFIWYPLLAVIMVVDDQDDQTVQAATGRILGTLVGGLVTFLVHTVLSGWAGVLVSLLLMIPVLRVFGWQASLSTAALVSVMFLMLPSHEALNWNYVFNRALDTVVGCVVAIGVGLLFWPRTGYHELSAADGRLRRSLSDQLERYAHWLQGPGERPRPAPLNVLPLSSDLQRIETLVNRERSGPRHRRLRASGWERRLRLWRQAHQHWIAWERLLSSLPAGLDGHGSPLALGVNALAAQLAGGGQPTPARNPGVWQAMARERGLPLLPLLALAEEQRPLHASLGAIGRSQPPC
ncbi:MAG: FUSC family protein [Vulcanococcus sp.]